MKELPSILHILRSTTNGVLATLVKAEGSSYRRVGARLLWRPDGLRLGSISGGCLEDDLIERARGVLNSGESELVVYDTTSENDLVWGVGLGCHGIVHVVLERVAGIPPAWEIAAQAWARRQPAVVALAFGDQPRFRGVVGAWTAMSGEFWQAEQAPADDIPKNVAQAFASQQSHYTAISTKDGSVPILWEFIPPPLRLVIFGAGNDAIPLSRLAKELGWRVIVVDPRPAYATAERFPLADEIHVLPAEAAASLAWDRWSVASVMTHHYRFDVPLLRALLPLNLPYLGLLGPKKRAEQILGELLASGLKITPEMRARLHAPVGLDLGGSSPETVALAIVAEIEANLNARDARPLRERQGPIHPPSQ